MKLINKKVDVKIKNKSYYVSVQVEFEDSNTGKTMFGFAQSMPELKYAIYQEDYLASKKDLTPVVEYNYLALEDQNYGDVFKVLFDYLSEECAYQFFKKDLMETKSIDSSKFEFISEQRHIFPMCSGYVDACEVKYLFVPDNKVYYVYLSDFGEGDFSIAEYSIMDMLKNDNFKKKKSFFKSFESLKSVQKSKYHDLFNDAYFNHFKSCKIDD